MEPPSPPAPRHSRNLVGSKWTREDPAPGPRHFVVEGLVGRGPTLQARLGAVLRAGIRVDVPWRDLRERSQWSPGWRSLDFDDDVDTSERTTDGIQKENDDA